MSTTPLVGLSVMPEPEYLAATLPLFEEGLVDTIEWSFDMAWRPGLPAWLGGLIHDYESVGQLRGHGVSLSPLSSHPRQERWFERFSVDAERHRFTHVSEHFGFMAAGDFRLGPPMPLPFSSDAVRTGRHHLARLQGLASCHVGLENLAFAFGEHDVWAQGEFLDALLEPVDGFLVLDVHNLWCQVVNFGIDADDLLATYPVDRVRECHVSGGSWSTSSSGADERRIRRDTHDGPVPPDVIDLLTMVLSRCPRVEAVIVEQIGSAFGAREVDQAFRDDYTRVRGVVGEASLPVVGAGLTDRRSPLDGQVFPAELMNILADATSASDALARLQGLDGVDTRWADWISGMDPSMVDTARELMGTWARRNDSERT